jgi:ABC-type branched-subunit amino acid transport system substrate-binding protein
MRRHRLLVALLGVSLLTTACGARLSDDQRQQALGAGGGRVAAGQGAVTTGADGLPLDPLAPAAEGGAVDPGTGAVDPAAGGSDPASGGDPAAAGTDPAAPAAPGAPGAPTDTRAAPPGGNGGSTDTGVTADKIVISNVSDISGAVPGLFKDAQDAVKAYVAYFTAREGTIYGRRLELLPLDSRLDTGAARSESIKACRESFAGVGSVSAFDQGAAPVIRDCGLPDIRGLATTDEMKSVPNAYPTFAAGQPGHRGMANYAWAARRFPNAVKEAGFLYSDGDVTRQVAQQDIEAAEKLHGYDFVYEGAIGVSETNYSTFVQQMKSKGVRYVTFVGAYQQAAALAKEMKRQGFTPDIYEPTVTAYTPDYLQVAGDAAENTYVPVPASLVEELQGNADLTLYAQFLNQVEPGARPTVIGQYAWGAARLFVEQAKAIGPNLTRETLLARLAGVRSFDGGGLYPKQDVGGKNINDCTVIVQVRGGKFVRVLPPEPRTFMCGAGVYDTKNDRVLQPPR